MALYRTPTRTIEGRTIVYNAAPTVAAFMTSSANIRLLLGPLGSGKTTGVMFEVLRRAAEQRPGLDGIRRTRFAIVRNTLSQLRQTVLRDVEQWLGNIMHYRVSENVIVIQVDDIYSEWFLVPLNDPEDKRRLLSTQYTGIWVSEFIELDSTLLADMFGRCGRFPSAEDGGCTWYGIVGDSNMPNEGSPWYKVLESERPSNVERFIQPGGLDEGAENLNFLRQTEHTLSLPLDDPARLAQGRKYYEEISIGRGKGWIKRYVDALYGDDPDGVAVFADTFSRHRHVKKRVLPGSETWAAMSEAARERMEEHGATAPYHSRTLFVAQDFGRTPCSLLFQIDPKGSMVVLDELVASNVALETHLATALLPLLMSDRYSGMKVLVVGDPSGMSAGVTTEASCFETLEEYGLAAQPAPTNLLGPRLHAVEKVMTRQFGDTPGLVIDGDRCPTLVQALQSSYRYAFRRDGNTRPVPEKSHPWSDLADCLQYGALCATGSFQTVAERALVLAGRRMSRSRRVRGEAGFRTHAGAQEIKPPPSPRGWT